MVLIVGECRLGEILKKKDITQVEFALKVGMKKQQINAYVNNESIMSLKTAATLAYHLRVPIEDLYDFIWSEQ
jgi:DNA-binding XRE family transcriptional regulator